MTCTIQHVSFQNTPDNLHNFVCFLSPSFHSVQLYHNAKSSDVDSVPTLRDGAKEQQRRKVKATARAKMGTSVINRLLSLGRDRMKGIILEHIHRLIRIYDDCGVEDVSAWDHFYDILFLDPVTTRHFSEFQMMWPHSRSRSSPLWVCWAVFSSYMGQMFVQTHDQSNNLG